MNMEKLEISLDSKDMEILREIKTESEDFANNSFVTFNDVISGFLNFYKNAKLIEYQKQFKEDIPIYIGNRVTLK